jgi:starch synthase
MKKHMTLMMASAECRGVAKVGGLADVVFDLSLRLAAQGHRVFVVLPLYADLPLARSAALEPVLDFQVPFEGGQEPARLHKTTVDGLEVHLVEAGFFQGEGGGVYVDSGKRGKGPFEDDARRFAFFSAALWELLQKAPGFRDVGVVHCHDWHIGPLPLLIRLDGQQKKFKTVFTIHNLDYQGTRPLDEPYAPGASWRQWFPERWEALQASGLLDAVNDPAATLCFNPLRCGIRLADAVNTVSPTYALEITQPDDPAANFLGGRGLEADLARRQAEGRLWGILNGLDYDTFAPGHLLPPFEADTPDLLARRKVHKTQLLAELPAVIDALSAKLGRRFGNAARVKAHLPAFLKAAQKRPLTVCVTRAVSQKLGLFTEDLVPGKPLYREFLRQGTALLVIGTGELEERLEPLNDEPEALFLQAFDVDFATRLYSAGELFLMPSDFEPCGISQLMALRYGCLPLVHDRGGLHDTVVGGETGFVFQGATRDLAKAAFLTTAAAAVKALKAQGYETMVRRAMEQRFEWTRSVADYEAIYDKVSKPG